MSTSQGHYPFVEAAGTPYEMGRSHGRQAAQRAHRFLAMLLDGQDPARVMAGVRRLRPLFERHVPRLVDEIRGLADGADLSLEEAYLLQIRGEAYAAANQCTTFAIPGPGTASGRLLIGQNSDMGPRQKEVGIVLHLIPDQGPRILMWTFAGQLGYHGMNSAGVAHFANALAGGPAWRLAMPHYPLKRLILEQATRPAILEVLHRVPVASSGNYMMCAEEAIFDVELTPEGQAILELPPEGPPFLVHTNHFLSDRFRSAQTGRAAEPDSFHRLERLTALIRDRFGRITLDDLKRFLSDHDRGPRSICRHEADEPLGAAPAAGCTVAGLIAEPAAGRLHVATGNPCEGRWRTYTV